MASFISTLSLFILVLVSSCFTLPIIHEPILTSTLSSLNEDSTTENPFSLRLVPDNEKIVLPDLEIKRPSDESMGREILTSTDSLSGLNIARASRTFDELFNPVLSTTEKSLLDKSIYDELLSTSVEPITEGSGIKLQSIKTEFEKGSEIKSDNREMPVESITHHLPSFTSTPSTVVTELSPSDLITTTQKYTGLLKDEVEDEERPTKYVKEQRTSPLESKETISLTSTKKTKVHSAEDSNELFVPLALFDQEALKKVSNIPNDVLILDENNDVITNFPERLSTSTMENKNEQKELKQGKESSLLEEKKSDI